MNVFMREHDGRVSELIAWGFYIVYFDVFILLILINSKVEV